MEFLSKGEFWPIKNISLFNWVSQITNIKGRSTIYLTCNFPWEVTINNNIRAESSLFFLSILIIYLLLIVRVKKCNMDIKIFSYIKSRLSLMLNYVHSVFY